jgi:hypothetical protein
MRRLVPIYLSAGASLGVIAAYLLAGGASYKPLTVADPCEPRPLAVLSERGVLEGIALSALDGAACELQVTREELIAALGDEQALAEFASEHGIDESDVDAAVRAGLIRAVDDAQREGALSDSLAPLVRGLAENAPVPVVIDLFRSLPGDPSLPGVLEALGELGLGIDQLRDLGIDDLDGLLDQLGGLIPPELGGLLPDPLPEHLEGLAP